MKHLFLKSEIRRRRRKKKKNMRGHFLLYASCDFSSKIVFSFSIQRRKNKNNFDLTQTKQYYS